MSDSLRGPLTRIVKNDPTSSRKRGEVKQTRFYKLEL